MRIVQAVGWYLPTSTGGTEVYVSELSKRLRAAGHEVLIAAPETLGQPERTYDEGGFPVYRYPIPPRVTRDESQGRVIVRGAELFHEWLRRTQPDVVHMHTYVTGLGLAELRAAKALGAKVIATTHSASLGFTCQRGHDDAMGLEAVRRTRAAGQVCRMPVGASRRRKAAGAGRRHDSPIDWCRRT